MGSSKLSKEWWEDLVVFLIRFWWAILLVIAIALVLYFTRNLWLFALGMI